MAITIEDIDWRERSICVHGKGTVTGTPSFLNGFHACLMIT
jgi:hypothetical protein